MKIYHKPTAKELVMFKELGLEFEFENSIQVYYKCSAKVLTDDNIPDWIRNSVKAAMSLLLNNPNINTSSDEFQDCIDEIVFLPTHKKCVHTEHCCIIHGCKYCDSDCVVANGIMAQSYQCEFCHDFYYDAGKPIKPIIVTKKMLAEIQERKNDDDFMEFLKEFEGDDR